MNAAPSTNPEIRRWQAIRIGKHDNIAVALSDIAGEIAVRSGENITFVKLETPIPMGHKFAIVDLKAGTEIVKYGEVIGVLVADVTIGEHVHIHNLKSLRAPVASERHKLATGAPTGG